MKTFSLSRYALPLCLSFAVLLAGSAFAQTGPGTALNFDGVNDYVSVPHNLAFNFSNALTIEAWIKTTSGVNSYIITKNDDSFYLAIGPDGTTAGRLAFYLNNVSAGWLEGTTSLTDDAWHHVAGTYDGANLKIYVDGQLQNSVAQSGNIQTGTNPVLIGARPFVTNTFAGLLDEVRIWNSARNQAQIQTNLNRSVSVPQTNLVAYWRFDEGTGVSAYDVSGNGDTGTLVNGPLWIASTIPFLPSVVTLLASQITTNSATLNALVNPNGLSATAWFQWGPTPSYGFSTPTSIVASGTNLFSVAIPLTGLSANQSFSYRVVATNMLGLAAGANQSSMADIGIPKLNIALTGTNVVLTWPTAATSFSLENVTNLVGSNNWSGVSRSPQVVNSQNAVVLAAGGTNQFFRLHQASASEVAFDATPVSNLGFESVANPSSGSRSDSSHNQGIGQIEGGSSGGSGEVILNNGEYLHQAVDLAVPGRGFNWKMERKYRSGITFDGPLGHNWDFSYNRRLSVQTNGDVLRMDGYGRTDRYSLTNTGYLAPTGFYTQLTTNRDGSFLERDCHGAKVYYSTTNGLGLARMTELRDRNGNRMQFQYNSLGQLSRVLDTLGRAYTYRYDSLTARLIEVDDFYGRSIKYSYDMHGDLKTETSPAVTGTPTGNDFPAGKTVDYSYSSGFTDDRLNHNLLTITAPNEVAASGPPRVVAQYQTDTNSPDVDRLTQLTIGGVNASGVPAGGSISYLYQSLGATGPNDFNTAVFQNTVTDRNGNQSEFRFNQLGNIVQIREFTLGLRAGEPAYYQTRYQYNSDGETLSRTNPLGNAFVYTYDSTNSDRFQQGNLLAITEYPDAVRGGDQAFLKTTQTYEPVYNYILTLTSARGNDLSYVPQNGGANSAARYTTTYTYDYQEGSDFASLGTELGITAGAAQTRLAGVPMALGDVNGDDQTSQLHGNMIRRASPTVNLLADSYQGIVEGSTTQPIVALSSFNQFGQVISIRDPEANVTQYSYNPENNPNGDGANFTPGIGAGPFGYLRQTVVDAVSSASRDSGANPTPASIVNLYNYDVVGNITRTIDARGIATDYAVNQLNQAVQVTRASAHNLLTPSIAEPLTLTDFQYLTRFTYDGNNNVVHREVEDRGNTSNTGGFIDTTSQYDILDNMVQTTSEVDTTNSLVACFRYDANGNRTLTVRPLGNAVTTRFDERNLAFQSTIGATSVSPETLGGFSVGGTRGGSPATYTVNYDQNANEIEAADAADKDGSPANNSSIAGVGDVTRTFYDGFDRPSHIVDAVGNQAIYNYDPAGNRVLVTRQGPVGGDSPINTLGSSNVNLSITEFKFDELNRPYQEDRPLFVSAGVTTQRTPNITDGPLTPGDNKVTTRHEYDRNSRQTFVVADDLRTSRAFYDGANRTIKYSDALSNTVENAYDGNKNLIETRRTDICQISAVPNEIFLTTFFYDSLGRLQRSVDNLGQTVESRYDSRGNLVAESDANGPVTGSISRRAFSGGPLTTNTINGFGNVTVYTYDGIGRKLRQDGVMTASGKGDGINLGADIFGVKTATPTPDITQAGGDGLITTRYAWDANSLLTSFTDDNGNQTTYTYDNLNRRLTENNGICTPPYADVCATPTTIAFTYNADGNRVQILDENGSVITNRFDAVGRLIARGIARATNVTGTTAVTYQYDGLSRVAHGTDDNDPAATNDFSAVTYAYDSLGRVIEESQQIGPTSVKAISYSWRSASLRTSLTYPNGRVITNTFDQLDRLSAIADAGTNAPIATYSYIGGMRLAERDYPNNTRLTYLDNAGSSDAGYDGLGRAVQMRHLAGATNMVLGFGHTYDRVSNPLIEKKLHALNDSELYHLDSDYRLSQFGRGTLSTSNSSILAPSLHIALQTNWVLDGVGNWKQVDNETRLHNSLNEIIQRSNTIAIAILSDRNGNETDNGTNLYQFDYRNRLRKITRKSDNALLASYAYDIQNRRISKMVTNSGFLNGTTRFYLSGQSEIEERNGVDAPVQQYVYGMSGELLTIDRNLNGDNSATGPGDQRLLYHQNKKRSVFALTDVTGKVVEAYQYDAYGTRTVFGAGTNGIVDFGGDDVVIVGGQSTFGNAYGFTARRLDSESGLYNSGGRYMSPIEGRSISRDSGGIAIAADEPPLNIYLGRADLPIISVTPPWEYVSAVKNIGKITIGFWTVLAGEGKPLFKALGETAVDWVEGHVTDKLYELGSEVHYTESEASVKAREAAEAQQKADADQAKLNALPDTQIRIIAHALYLAYDAGEAMKAARTMPSAYQAGRDIVYWTAWRGRDLALKAFNDANNSINAFIQGDSKNALALIADAEVAEYKATIETTSAKSSIAQAEHKQVGNSQPNIPNPGPTPLPPSPPPSPPWGDPQPTSDCPECDY